MQRREIDGSSPRREHEIAHSNEERCSIGGKPSRREREVRLVFEREREASDGCNGERPVTLRDTGSVEPTFRRSEREKDKRTRRDRERRFNDA